MKRNPQSRRKYFFFFIFPLYSKGIITFSVFFCPASGRPLILSVLHFPYLRILISHLPASAPVWLQTLISSLYCFSVFLTAPRGSNLPPPLVPSPLTLLPECLFYLINPIKPILCLKPTSGSLLPRRQSPHCRVCSIKCIFDLALSPAQPCLPFWVSLQPRALKYWCHFSIAW